MSINVEMSQEVGQAMEELSKAGCQAIFERPLGSKGPKGRGDSFFWGGQVTGRWWICDKTVPWSPGG